MSNLQLGLTQVTSKVWVGKELNAAEIQFLDSVGSVNEQPESTVLLEDSYNLELYRRSKGSLVQVHMTVTSEGYVCVYLDGATLPDFFSLEHDDAYWHACELIDGRG